LWTTYGLVLGNLIPLTSRGVIGIAPTLGLPAAFKLPGDFATRDPRSRAAFRPPARYIAPTSLNRRSSCRVPTSNSMVDSQLRYRAGSYAHGTPIAQLLFFIPDRSLGVRRDLVCRGPCELNGSQVTPLCACALNAAAAVSNSMSMPAACRRSE